MRLLGQEIKEEEKELAIINEQLNSSLLSIPNIPTNLSEEPSNLNLKSLELRKENHKVIKNITQCLEEFKFNVAVAKIHELVNILQDSLSNNEISGWVKRECIETILRLSNPMVPHITEELWQKLGHTVPLSDQPWPEPIHSLYQEENFNISIQINGKHRASIIIPKTSKKNEVEDIAKQNNNINKALINKTIAKTIYVPGRIFNFVISK